MIYKKKNSHNKQIAEKRNVLMKNKGKMGKVVTINN